MTIEDVLDRVPGKILIHRGQVFFNTWSSQEASEWQRMGAHISPPFYPESEVTSQQRRKVDVPQGWEVHILGCIEPIWEEGEDGDEVNVTREVLLECARERVAA